jgi:predicted DCC family thiol-disulfide oxidoreductase YuxK
VKSLLRHYTRIDARSLGLFRIFFGIVLLLDVFGRMGDVTAFYSNEGVLPNHAHLYYLKAQGRFVWSALHAFNTPGEALVGLSLIAVCYAFFTIGYKTRFFHALSILGLVCLVARNLLIEGPGEPLALALAFVTLLLPLGSAFSLDAILQKARSMRETRPAQLGDPAALFSRDEIQARRLPGWSPYSLGAVGAWALCVVFFLSLARQQIGPAWQDGSALRQALHIHMFASPIGFQLRDSALLGWLTHAFRVLQWAIPLLIVMPVLRSPARGIAAAAIALIGLGYALLSNFTLFGLSVASMSLLMLSNDAWEKWSEKRDGRRARTVIFDVDCGICFWLSKLLRRYDTREHLLVQGNDVIDSNDELPLMYRDTKSLAPHRRAIPAGITRELVEQTIVVVRPDGSFTTHGAAVVEILRALPGFSLLAFPLSLPGIRDLFDAAYRIVAKNRTRISIEVGLNACGVASHATPIPLKEPLSPFRAASFRAMTGVREVAAVLIVGAVLSQATVVNPIGFTLPHPSLFDTFNWWSRTTGKWTLLVPEPAREQGAMIVDTTTAVNPQSKIGAARLARGDSPAPRSFDALNGSTPVFQLDRPFRLGGRWALYLDKVQRDENRTFQTSFKTYLGKRGVDYDAEGVGERISGVDAYWLSRPTLPAPGEEPQVRRVFRQGRGGSHLLEAFAALGGTGAATTSTGPRARPLLPREEPPRGEPQLEDDYVPPPALESPGLERPESQE